MKQLKDFLKVVEDHNKGELFEMVHGLSVRILSALTELGDKEEAVKWYCTFILTTLAADGRLADEEFLTVEPMFDAFFGNSFDYKTCKQLVKQVDDKSVVAAVVSVLNRMPSEIQSDMILAAIILCAIDGKISAKEQAYIQKLLD